MISNKDGLELLAQIFISHGISEIVISPGSRNAPMMLTFPQYEEFKIYSIVDERSAAFFALGLAQKSGKPVVLNCTSGSAVLNYAPALAEAFYQQVPLIVLSADRPEYLVDQGDGQTIRQQEIYGNYIRKSVNLPESFSNEEDKNRYQQLVIEAIDRSINPVFGPVHINVPLDEPIYGQKEKTSGWDIPKPAKPVAWRMPDNDKNAFQTAWLSARKRMIIVGQHAPDAHLSKLLEQLALQKNTVVLTETTSNMNFPCFTNAIDQVLTQITAEKEHEFFPDVVLTFGGHIVSKKIKAWLRNSTDFQHFNISPDYQAPDTFLHLSKHLRCQTADVLKIAIEGPSAEEDFIRNWQQITMKAKTIHQEFMETIPYSDFRVFRELHASLTTKTQLHFANSTSIRYSQFFDFDRHIIDGNRGVSGIDGSTSTALGQSLHFEGQTILVTGDLSFFYDINALWNNYLHSNFKILLINNSGGGIFRFLDGPLKSGQIDLFETPHNRTAQHLAQDAGMKYLYCREASNLSTKIHELIESSQSTILEVFTPRQVNDVVLNDYFRFLRNSTL